MAAQSVNELIRRELPTLLREDPSLRSYLRSLLASEFADRGQTEDRFDRLFAELRRSQEEQSHRWEETNKRLEEQSRQWFEQQKWMQEQEKKWREQDLREEDHRRSWKESADRFNRVHEEIMAMSGKLERKVGALGARWGMQSESAFRNALAGILEEHFGVQVLNVNEVDEEGTVFGHPDQVEIDIIIKNGLLILAELKSSIDKPGMYIFERKARFYERRHGRKADRLIVISPMIDKKAQKVADKLGIKTYSDSSEVEEL
jgi:hypothetical protein